MLRIRFISLEVDVDEDITHDWLLCQSFKFSAKCMWQVCKTYENHFTWTGYPGL